MQYALLIYNPDDGVAERAQRPIDPDIAAVLARPDVTGWIRLHAAGSATTVHHQDGRTLLTDGPFVDSKEFLGGLVVVEADNCIEECGNNAVDLRLHLAANNRREVEMLIARLRRSIAA